MSSYIKISYKTEALNLALKKCIMYIGKYYGSNNDDIYKTGKKIVAKQSKTSKTAIQKMVYSQKIKNKDKVRQWSFKKRSYNRAYRYIIYRMLHTPEHKEEALSLLHSLYMELRNSDQNTKKILSTIIVSEQKDLLEFASDKPQYENDKKYIKKILKEYNDCDNVYNNYIN